MLIHLLRPLSTSIVFLQIAHVVCLKSIDQPVSQQMFKDKVMHCIEQKLSNFLFLFSYLRLKMKKKIKF